MRESKGGKGRRWGNILGKRGTLPVETGEMVFEVVKVETLYLSYCRHAATMSSVGIR